MSIDWEKERQQELHEEIEAGASLESGENWQQPGDSSNDPALRNRDAASHTAKGPGFLEKYKHLNQRAQYIALFVGLLALALMPLFPSVSYRVTVSVFCVTLALRLLVLHLEKIDKVLGEQGNKIDRVGKDLVALDKRLKPSTPTRFDDFSACEPFLKAECLKILRDGEDLTLDLQVVAAMFSWKFFQEKLVEWSRDNSQRKITFNIALVRPEDLIKLGAPSRWVIQCEAHLNEMRAFATETKCPNLAFRAYLYDRIPDVHGILINSRTLFRGWTEWEYRSDAPPDLKVGSRPYRRFSTDNSDEAGEIRRFSSWVRWARMRDEQLTALRPAIVKSLSADSPKLPARVNRLRSAQKPPQAPAPFGVASVPPTEGPSGTSNSGTELWI